MGNVKYALYLKYIEGQMVPLEVPPERAINEHFGTGKVQKHYETIREHFLLHVWLVHEIRTAGLAFCDKSQTAQTTIILYIPGLLTMRIKRCQD